MTKIESELREAVERLSKATRQDYVVIGVEVSHFEGVIWTAYAHTGTHQKARTMEEAIEKSIADVAPARRVAALREQAEKALAEAREIEAKEVA